MHPSLQGQWYLIYTNFSMWKNPKVRNVTFNYTATKKDGIACLLDEVKYVKAGKADSIVGYDYIDDTDAHKLIWQGKGWMFWIKCPWKIEWVNKTRTCIVLSFEKTLLTGGGVDIVTRAKEPDNEILEEALTFIAGSERLRAQGANSIRVVQG